MGAFTVHSIEAVDDAVRGRGIRSPIVVGGTTRTGPSTDQHSRSPVTNAPQPRLADPLTDRNGPPGSALVPASSSSQQSMPPSARIPQMPVPPSLSATYVADGGPGPIPMPAQVTPPSAPRPHAIDGLMASDL